MCISIPGRIVSIDGNKALVNINGLETSADLSLVEDVRPGDYVLVHTGFAIQKYNKKDAEETLILLRKAAEQYGL